MTAMPPRFEITPGQIDDQMRAFYIEIRRHPVPGPVFNGRIGDGMQGGVASARQPVRSAPVLR